MRSSAIARSEAGAIAVIAALFCAVPVAASSTTTGSISGTIALDDQGLRFPPGTPVIVSVTRSDTRVAVPEAKVRLGAIAAHGGTRTIDYAVSGLPLGVGLEVIVRPGPLPGATPLSTAGFSTIVLFHPHGTGAPPSELAEGYDVTLTSAKPVAAHRDFGPYELEVVPQPPANPSPSPATT